MHWRVNSYKTRLSWGYTLTKQAKMNVVYTGTIAEVLNVKIAMCNSLNPDKF